MHYANIIEQQQGENIHELEVLLDDLDHTATIIFQGLDNKGDKSPKFSHFNWTMTEPSQNNYHVDEKDWSTFISLAIECNLASYVEAKLRNGQASISTKNGRSLLEYALFPKITVERSRVRNSDKRYEFIGGVRASPRLVETLLRYGADPNGERADGSTFWEAVLLGEGKPSNSWQGEVLKAFIKYDADPFLGISQGSNIRSALFIISDRLKKDQKLVKDLTNALKAKGGRFFEGEQGELERCKTSSSVEGISVLNHGPVSDPFDTWFKRMSPSGEYTDTKPIFNWPKTRTYNRYSPFGGSNRNQVHIDFDTDEEQRIIPNERSEVDEVHDEINFHLKRLEELQKLRLKAASS